MYGNSIAQLESDVVWGNITANPSMADGNALVLVRAVARRADAVTAGERAVIAAMCEAGTGLKTAWRLQITGAWLGTRLANSIRLANFPRSG